MNTQINKQITKNKTPNKYNKATENCYHNSKILKDARFKMQDGIQDA
jgi:hypothetical protein